MKSPGGKIENEIKYYKEIENVHDLPLSHNYIANKYLKKLLSDRLGISSFPELVVNHINLLKTIKNEADIEILSLGSGNCDFEINLACDNKLKCNFTCYELSPHMLERAKKSVENKPINKNFKFVECDINEIGLEEKYDIVIANHSLHHFVGLEHIFSEVDKCMDDSSFFLINDMIGRNGHMFWNSTFDMCNRIWAALPKELKYNHQLCRKFKVRVQWDCSVNGFEGIRAEDILPLLDETFNFKVFGPFFSLSNRFIDRDFGHNFDVDNELHRSILDMIWQYDDYCLKEHILKPTHMMASLVKKNIPVDDYRYTYFEKPSEAYQLDDSNYYNQFDRFGVFEIISSRLPGKLVEIIPSKFLGVLWRYLRRVLIKK